MSISGRRAVPALAGAAPRRRVDRAAAAPGRLDAFAGLRVSLPDVAATSSSATSGAKLVALVVDVDLFVLVPLQLLPAALLLLRRHRLSMPSG